METDSAVGATWIGYAWDDSCTGGSMKRDVKPPIIAEQQQKIIKPAPDYRLIPNLYKNNFTAHITLGEDEQGEVTVYDIQGKMMGMHKVVSGTNQIDLGNDGLQAGVYIYKATVNGEVKTNGKLIVVH